MTAEIPLVRLTVLAEESLVAPVCACLTAAARARGLEGEELHALHTLAEAVCRGEVTHAFDPGEQGVYSVEVIWRPEQIVLAVEDRGLPGHDGTGIDDSGLDQAPVRGLAHEVFFRNLGRNGKRIEYRRNLPARSIEDYLPHDERLPFRTNGNAPPKATDAVTLRQLTVDDALALSRLIYRAYGYTYGSEFVYYPDRIVERLESRLMESCVAVNEAGELVGHTAMLLRTPDARVGESAMAVVDPRYRGRKLFERMKETLGTLARARGMLGLYSEAVAVHTFTQRGNLALGGFETGFLLGFTPNTQVFRQIRDEEALNRQTAVLFHVRINDGPARQIFVPSQHAAIIEAIHASGDMPRHCVTADPRLTLHAVQDRHSVLEINAREDVGRAFLLVIEYGGDILSQVYTHVQALCRRGLACIYLDLPLANPLTAVLCKAFESLGFSFAGLVLDLVDSDVLRLQYLNGVAINPDEIQVASRFGEELLAYVLDARAAVARLHLP